MAALVASVVTLTLLSAGYLVSVRMGRKQIKEKITQASKRLGAPIEYGRVRLGIGSASIDDIRIGEESNILISRMTAEANLNPFSDRFGELDALTIHRVRVKMGKELFTSQLNKLTASAPQITTNSKGRHFLEKFFQAIPTDQLWLKSGNIVIVDPNGEPFTSVSGLQVLIEKTESKVLFRVGSVKTNNGLSEDHLQGRFQLIASSDQYRFFLRKKNRTKDASNDWAITGRIARDLSDTELRLDVRRIPGFLREALKPILGDKPAIDVTAALKARREPDGPWRFDTKITSKDLRITVPVLAANAVGPFRFELTANGFYRSEDRMIAIEEAIAAHPPKTGRSEPIRIHVSGAGRLGDLTQLRNLQTNSLPLAGFRWQGQARLMDASCQSLVDASPANFTPTLDDFKIDGQVGGAINLSFDGDKPNSLSFELNDLSWTCRVTEAPYAYSSHHLSGPLTLQRAVGKDQAGKHADLIEVSVSPQSPGYTPLSGIAKTVNNAFIASEDAGFYSHKGIDSFALESAARRNFAEKRVAVGGSTITMQTVKNLFLTHERTVSRKLQELFLAWHLENTLDKDRILEIYLNIVEYGPGIYGITQAANHFFGKNPFDLTLMESA